MHANKTKNGNKNKQLIKKREAWLEISKLRRENGASLWCYSIYYIIYTYFYSYCRNRYKTISFTRYLFLLFVMKHCLTLKLPLNWPLRLQIYHNWNFECVNYRWRNNNNNNFPNNFRMDARNSESETSNGASENILSSSPGAASTSSRERMDSDSSDR